MAVTSNTPPPEDEIPHVDITHDLNGDGRDDLVVPDSDGFLGVHPDGRWHARRSSDRSVPPLRRTGSMSVDGYRYNPWVEGQCPRD